MSHQIIEASAGTIEPLIEMMREFYVFEKLSFNEGKLRSLLSDMFKDKTLGRIYIAKAGNQYAGYSILTFGYSLEYYGRDALVDELYVREAYRGKGIGGSLLSRFEEICMEQNIYALHLEVDHTNYNAQEVYRKKGYKDHDRYLMTKWLRGVEPERK